MKKAVALIISLMMLGLLVYSLLWIEQQPQMANLRANFAEELKAFFHLENNLNPLRRPPVTFVELEANLKHNLAIPFRDFIQEDWQRFWRLLYGHFPIDKQGWISRKRQLTRDEIQQMLADNYQQPFSSFDQRQWQIFWQYTLRGKVF